MKYESTLTKIAEKVFSAKDFQDAKDIFIKHVSNTKVKDRDKMIQDVSELNSLASIQRYTANSLLKFEGLGLN